MRRGVLVGRIDDVDEVMRNALLLRERHLVGADVEAAIHGGRIAIDDLAAELVSQRNRQRALANRRRTENRDDERRWHARPAATWRIDAAVHHVRSST